MLKFLKDHKDWVAGAVGAASILAAPHFGVPPEQLTHDAYVIGGIAISLIAGHHWGNGSAPAAEAPKP